MFNLNQIEDINSTKENLTSNYPLFKELTPKEQNIFLQKYPTEYEGILNRVNKLEDLRSFITTAEKFDNDEQLF